MKKAKPIKEKEEESLPFSFLKEQVDDEKVNAHWQRIKEKIELQEPGSTGPDQKDKGKDE